MNCLPYLLSFIFSLSRKYVGTINTLNVLLITLHKTPPHLCFAGYYSDCVCLCCQCVCVSVCLCCQCVCVSVCLYAKYVKKY